MDIELIIDIGIYITYLLLLVGALAATVMPLINSISNPKTLVKAGIGVAVLIVLFGISYLLADNEVIKKYGTEMTPGLSQVIGGVLTMMYLLGGLAIVLIIYTEVNKILK